MNFLDENGLGRLWAQIILKLNSKVPDGGTTGQILKKTETGTEWADAPQTVTIPETTALLKGDGVGGVSAAVKGTDYWTEADKQEIIDAVLEQMPESGGGSAITLASIAVTKAPTKTIYRPGEAFDPTGMVVTATYSNGVKRTLPLCDITYTPTGSFYSGSNGIVTIQYVEGGIIAKVEYKVTVFVTKDVFSENSWDVIIAACQLNSVPDTWTVGSSKPMTIGDKDYVIDIIGKDHDTYDGTTKAPLTFQLHDCYDTLYDTASRGPQGAGVDGFNSTHSNFSGESRGAYSVRDAMPADIKNKIRSVKKKASAGYDPSVGNQNKLETTSRTIFLLTSMEVFGESKGALAGEGTQYAYYAAGNTKIKNVNGSAVDWWLMSPSSPNSTRTRLYVDATGEAKSADVTSTKGIAPAFCF